MSDIIVKVVASAKQLPSYQSAEAAGMDLHAAVKKTETLQPGERRLIPTGIKLAIPVGFEAQVRPRSSLALKFGVTVLNAPGTIDSDYRGEVGVVLINHGQEPFSVASGERIAQLVFQRVERVTLEPADSLPATVRGEGGYGSTGR